MNHRPFEDWIFSEEPLSPVERADLEAHLQACAACQKLSTNWQEVSGALHTAPMLSPAPGFSSRWQER
ncbi:MAG: zf-HC2 domain-containing protein, partial [Anaerolineales bacterium]|nr:zf-HC2 domain-containing protein [Anaerolineales bacterium]